MAIANPHHQRSVRSSGGGRDTAILTHRLIIVLPHPTEPHAVAVKPEGACGSCGIDLTHRSIAVFDRHAGIICTDCVEQLRGNFERCPDCGALLELGDSGVRLVAGGGRLHDCPAAEYDVFALAAQLRERRQVRA